MTCNDIDGNALEATALNAAANNVSDKIKLCGDDLIGVDVSSDFDIIIAGDVAYEDEMARRVMQWLEEMRERRVEVLVGCPGRSYLRSNRLCKVASYQVPEQLIENASYGQLVLYFSFTNICSITSFSLFTASITFFIHTFDDRFPRNVCF